MIGAYRHADIRNTLGDGVRQEFESPGGRDAANAPQDAKLGDQGPVRGAEHGPGVTLVEARDVAPHTESELVLVFAREPQLAERDTELRHPAEAVHGGSGVPHAVPGEVFGGIGIDRIVPFYPRWIHSHFDAGAAVTKRVDDNLDLVRARLHIAAAQQVGNAVRMRIKRADQHVEEVIVVRGSHLGAECRLEVFTGIELPERRHRLRGFPHHVVLAPVDDRRFHRPNGRADFTACRGGGRGFWPLTAEGSNDKTHRSQHAPPPHQGVAGT